METTKTIQVKFNGWHEVKLTGNLMTGDTYKIKDFIKKYLNGKWYAQGNGWTVDLNAVEKYTTEAGTLMVR